MLYNRVFLDNRCVFVQTGSKLLFDKFSNNRQSIRLTSKNGTLFQAKEALKPILKTFISIDGIIHRWTGAHYQTFDLIELENWLHETINEVNAQRAAAGASVCDYNGEFCKRLADELCSNIRYREIDADLIPNHRYAVFKNGIFDKETRQFLAGQKYLDQNQDNIPLQSFPITYPPADHQDHTPTWDMLIDNVKESDRDALIAMLQKILLGENNQLFLELSGESGSGKGTLVKWINSLFGKDFTIATSMRTLANNRFEGTRLHQKSIIIIEEFPQHLSPDERNILLNLTGGGYVTHELKGQNKTFDFVQKGTLITTSNHVIKSGDDGGALQRRRVLVQMSCAQNDVDVQFLDKLISETPMIVKRILSVSAADCKAALYSNRYTNNDAKELATADSIVLFTKQHISVSDDSFSVLIESDIYRYYSAFCKINNNKPSSKSIFIEQFINLIKGQMPTDVVWQKTDERGVTVISNMKFHQVSDLHNNSRAWKDYRDRDFLREKYGDD